MTLPFFIIIRDVEKEVEVVLPNGIRSEDKIILIFISVNLMGLFDLNPLKFSLV